MIRACFLCLATQLLANYGAEKQLWFMRDTFFKLEEGLYTSEAIVFPRVAWWDNDNIVRVMESLQKPPGIFSVLEDACMYNTAERWAPLCVLCESVAWLELTRVNTSTDVIPSLGACLVSFCFLADVASIWVPLMPRVCSTFLLNLDPLTRQPEFVRDPAPASAAGSGSGKSGLSPNFTIKHSWADTSYTSTDFVRDNRIAGASCVPMEVAQSLASSTHAFVRGLFMAAPTDTDAPVRCHRRSCHSRRSSLLLPRHGCWACCTCGLKRGACNRLACLRLRLCACCFSVLQSASLQRQACAHHCRGC